MMFWKTTFALALLDNAAPDANEITGDVAVPEVKEIVAPTDENVEDARFTTIPVDAAPKRRPAPDTALHVADPVDVTVRDVPIPSSCMQPPPLIDEDDWSNIRDADIAPRSLKHELVAPHLTAVESDKLTNRSDVASFTYNVDPDAATAEIVDATPAMVKEVTAPVRAML